MVKLKICNSLKSLPNNNSLISKTDPIPFNLKCKQTKQIKSVSVNKCMHSFHYHSRYIPGRYNLNNINRRLGWYIKWAKIQK